jgi:hypothetical protein
LNGVIGPIAPGGVRLGEDEEPKASGDPSRRGLPMVNRPQKITLGEMRDMGVRGLLVYCSDYQCSHSVAISGDRWPDHVRLSELEPLFVCQACGTRPAELRPDFDWNRTQPGNVQRPSSMPRHATQT